jgi:hypothetical protein
LLEESVKRIAVLSNDGPHGAPLRDADRFVAAAGSWPRDGGWGCEAVPWPLVPAAGAPLAHGVLAAAVVAFSS